MANSSMLCFPRSTAPEARTFCVTIASYGGSKSARIRLPQVVRTPRVQKMSLSPTGTPCSGPSGSPRACSSSHAAARAFALSGRTVM